GGGVIEAFYDGYALAESVPWDFLAKLDGDLAFDPNYFQACFDRFEADSKLGIGGGRVHNNVAGTFMDDSPGDPSFHVRGATKIYRRQAWQAIGGLLRSPGWDTLDEIKANMLGWTSYSFKDLAVRQLKSTGSADGAWKNWFKNGRANYITGYHPLFMASKCLRRAFSKPYGIGAAGLFCGFISGYWNGAARVPDPALIRFVRKQQLDCLLFRASLWARK
ncbi:MAG: glycosyltransferase family 2 protein, partial [Verrucomicrobia bacterium]|nr:glycosyltransferase family 2 protein [Verrucomicrobiota bacterium]